MSPERQVPTVDRAERGNGTSGLDRTSPEVEALISATWTVAAQTGSIDPGVREILQEAGLSTKAFYRHFKSKDELLLEALDRASAILVAYLEHRMSSAPDPLSRIGAWIEGSLRQATNPRVARRILPWTMGFGRLAVLFPDQLGRTQEQVTALLEREIRAAVADGSGQSPDPASDAAIIFGFTSAAVQHHLLTGTAPDQTTTAALTAFAHRALGAQPPA